MAPNTICVECGHLRATHTTGIGELDGCCFMPKCKCRIFEEWKILKDNTSFEESYSCK